MHTACHYWTYIYSYILHSDNSKKLVTLERQIVILQSNKIIILDY